MKILFFAQDVTPSARSGDAVHVRELVANLTSLGHSLIVMGRDLEGVSKEDYKLYQKVLSGLESKRLKFILLSGRFKLSFFPVRLFHTFTKGLKTLHKEKVDLIYTRSINCRLEVFLSQLLRIPLVVEINGLEDEERELMAKKLVFRAPKRLRSTTYKSLLRFPRRIITVTELLKNILVKDYDVPAEKVSVIHNGANTELFRPRDQQECRMELGLNLNDNYICFVGSLEPWQGIEYLIRSIPRISNAIKNVKFLIVGDGLLKEELERLSDELGIGKLIKFTGYVPYSEVPTYINASDVCVAPFTYVRNEKIGLSPLKIYEYLACGKPVVATSIRGVGDLITMTNSGIVVRPENERNLAEAIVRLLSNKELRDEMGKRGAKVVEEQYSWKSVAHAVSGVLMDTRTGG
jgi:glycosyltransferase involved in cell wall biosynthesis